MIYILTMIIIVGTTPVTLVVEHSSKDACEVAKERNRDGVQNGKVVLATCNPK